MSVKTTTALYIRIISFTKRESMNCILTILQLLVEYVNTFVQDKYYLQITDAVHYELTV